MSEDRYRHAYKNPLGSMSGPCVASCGREADDPLHLADPLITPNVERYLKVATGDPFPFVVGDRITSPDLGPDGSIVITAIGEQGFLGRVYGSHGWRIEGTEGRFNLSGNRWERYVEPVVYPERWITISRSDSVNVHSTEDDARRWTRMIPVRGILHLRPDGTTEMLDP